MPLTRVRCTCAAARARASSFRFARELTPLPADRPQCASSATGLARSTTRRYVCVLRGLAATSRHSANPFARRAACDGLTPPRSARPETPRPLKARDLDQPAGCTSRASHGRGANRLRVASGLRTQARSIFPRSRRAGRGPPRASQTGAHGLSRAGCCVHSPASRTLRRFSVSRANSRLDIMLLSTGGGARRR